MRRLTGAGPNPSGLCQCGCGLRAPICRFSNTATGDIIGTPRRFILGHHIHTVPGGPHLKHGHSFAGTRKGKASPEYHSWQAMKSRCYNSDNNRFYLYGAKGVQVCDRWLDVEHGFENFLFDMGEKPEPKRRYSIDRYPDNNGNYEPGNCRWATFSQQTKNNRYNSPQKPITRATRRSNQPLHRKDISTDRILVLYFDKGMSMPQISDALECSIPTISRRIRKAGREPRPLGINQFSAKQHEPSLVEV